MKAIKMVEVTRSNFTESIHHGIAVLINSSGEVLKEWGDSNMPIYPRSALKPIQSLNLYKGGIAEALNLTDKAIALTTASHHAETVHQKMVNDWLKKMNLNENHLSCGPAWPSNKHDQFKGYLKYKTKRRIFHNCSGKHCAHLAVCQYKNLPIKNYQNKNHLIQKELILLIEDLSKYKIKNIGVDGCTLPNPLMPLKKFALAVAQIADYAKLDDHLAIAKRIFDSCVKYPVITGGSKSISSILTKFSKGKVFFKNGAEGVFIAIIPEQKSALAVKIVDGASRAAEVAIAGLISELKIINSKQIKKITKSPVRNSTGKIVGSVNWIY